MELYSVWEKKFATLLGIFIFFPRNNMEMKMLFSFIALFSWTPNRGLKLFLSVNKFIIIIKRKIKKSLSANLKCCSALNFHSHLFL